MLGLQLISSRFGNLFYVDFYMDRYIMYLWYIFIWNKHINIIIDHYFADTEAATFRGRPRTSLPSTLCSDLRRIGRTLRQPADIEALRALSREQWRQMERDTSAWDELPYPLTHILICLPRIYLF